MWRDVAASGNLVPTVPPVFDTSDLFWVRGDPRYILDKGHWSLNLWGVPDSNVPWYGNDPNKLYDFGTGETWPAVFFFGIKSGPDQGYVYRYEWNPTLAKFLPTGSSGLIGGRNSLFDTNAYIRSGNRMLAILVVTVAVGSYFAFAAEGAAAAGGGAAGAAGGAGEVAAGAGQVTAGAGTAAETAAAADIAGGLVPAYGSSAAYDAAIAAGAAVPAAQGAATAGAWDKLIDAAIGQGTKFASSALVSTIAKQTKPGQSPASSNQVAGEYPLPDGSRARVNPDGSITVLDSSGHAQVIGAGGAVSSQWFPGISNMAVFMAGIALAAMLLRGFRKG
jgi:hypothetical protein